MLLISLAGWHTAAKGSKQVQDLQLVADLPLVQATQEKGIHTI
jgi:hypothetical protein